MLLPHIQAGDMHAHTHTTGPNAPLPGWWDPKSSQEQGGVQERISPSQLSGGDTSRRTLELVLQQVFCPTSQHAIKREEMYRQTAWGTQAVIVI